MRIKYIVKYRHINRDWMFATLEKWNNRFINNILNGYNQGSVYSIYSDGWSDFEILDVRCYIICG